MSISEATKADDHSSSVPLRIMIMGRCCTLDVRPSVDTVIRLKDMITDKEGIRRDQQRLFYCGFQLPEYRPTTRGTEGAEAEEGGHNIKTSSASTPSLGEECLLEDFGIGVLPPLETAEGGGSPLQQVTLLPRLPADGMKITIKARKPTSSSLTDNADEATPIMISVSLNVRPTDTVAKVKEMLQDEVGIGHPDRQRLIHTGLGTTYDMEDDRSIGDYPIVQDESALLAVVRNVDFPSIILRSLEHNLRFHCKVFSPNDTLEQVLRDLKTDLAAYLEEKRGEGGDSRPSLAPRAVSAILDEFNADAIKKLVDSLGPGLEPSSLGPGTIVSSFNRGKGILFYKVSSELHTESEAPLSPFAPLGRLDTTTDVVFEMGRKKRPVRFSFNFFRLLLPQDVSRGVQLPPREDPESCGFASSQYDPEITRVKDVEADLTRRYQKRHRIWAYPDEGPSIEISSQHANMTLESLGCRRFKVQCEEWPSRVPSTTVFAEVQSGSMPILTLELQAGDSIKDLKARVEAEWGPVDISRPSTKHVDMDLRLLFVKTQAGNTLALEMHTGDSIKDVKAKVEAEWGVPAHMQGLILDGQDLDNTVRLEDPVEWGSAPTIHLVLRSEGATQTGRLSKVSKAPDAVELRKS